MQNMWVYTCVSVIVPHWICTNKHLDSSLLRYFVQFLHYFSIEDVEPKYYADGEDAYAMRRCLVTMSRTDHIQPADVASFYESKKGAADGKLPDEVDDLQMASATIS